MRRRTRRVRDDRGSAVWVTPFVGLLAIVALVLAFQGGVLVAQRRVQSAADLAALAGASALQRAEDGCAAAHAIAARNHATVQDCRAEGRELVLTLARDGPAVLGRSVEVRASARAGPAQPP